ncbi:hypothetical protein ACQ4PT_045097 [Festuca glaucescens]
MANYPCDPYALLPPGMDILPPGPLCAKRGYVVVGGDLPMICDDWTIAVLALEAAAYEFNASVALIEHFLEGKGWGVKISSRCGMGAALIQFNSAAERDAAINTSSHFIGDTVLRFLPQNKGINHRNAVFTHECWLMLVNYPLECWDVDTVVRTMAPFGRFVVWNKDGSNKARILVKIRPFNIDTLPLGIVVLRNNNDLGNGDSWSCPTYILSRTLLGEQGADEDPLPPHDVSPHPMPMGFDDIWAGGHGHGGAATPLQQAEHDQHLEQLVDHVVVLQDLIGTLVANANELLPKLGNSKITAASCKIVDVEGENGMERKCYVKITTRGSIVPAMEAREVIELSDDEVHEIVPKNKRKKKDYAEAGPARRSTKIALKLGGYKDMKSVVAVGFTPQNLKQLRMRKD